MGLLGKVIGAGASLIGSGAEAIGRGIEKAFLKQEMMNLEYLAKYPYKYKYIIREVKEAQSDMEFAKDFGVKKNFFVVYSSKNNPILLAYSEEKFGKYKYTLVDMAANEIAVLVSKKKHCTIECGNDTYELKYSELFDKPKFTLNNSNFKMTCNATGKEIRVQKGGNNTSMQINKVPSDLGAKWGEYVVGCNNNTDVTMTILLGIAVGTVLMQSANLLVAD
jgi:hypothetical protein